VLAIYLLSVAAVVGLVASSGDLRSALLYVPLALVGAFLGALAAFGDAPFLLRYPIFNSFTLAFLGSVVLVCAARFFAGRKTT
jgi:uncharacterized membrane protein YeaQ/YmgE (transglycosylase-associated protein family)